MKRISWNDGWVFSRAADLRDRCAVVLPHDAMLQEERTAESAGGTNTGWFREADYLYEKKFMAPDEWREQEVWIEFEGIYHYAEISLNGHALGRSHHGYLSIRERLNENLQFGTDNILRVAVCNSEQPSSRWYSGAGIYRPVWLELLPKEHLVPESISIQTVDLPQRRIRVSFEKTGAGPVRIEILDNDQVMATRITEQTTAEIPLQQAALWSVETPKLYTCRLTYAQDVQQVRFGIRTIEVDARKGFRINGQRTLLLGACIHHDNGLLGAVGHPFAERRKIALLKKAGYNAIRSAHNPVSKAILEACDELGMMVLDEYADMWYIHKTQYDEAAGFEQNWRNDLKQMVEKDRNHPSVVMYSIGNEVSETAQPRGIRLTGEMRNYLHLLDDRPVTCGINLFFNYLSSLGFGVYSDEKAEKEAGKNRKKKKAVGSEFINGVAGFFGAGFMKFGATLPGSDAKTRDAFAALDVAGYNYGIDRYKKDLKKDPDRVILGSETFASDAAAFFDLAAEHPALIGDFVWTGMDYLGEVGLGAWEYREYAPDFGHGPGWITAGAGMIDLIGTETCQLAYMQAAFGKATVRLGVIPVRFAGQKHSPAAWRFTNAVESWAWNGCEGMKTTVEVYARGEEAELYLNERSLGRKRIPVNCRTSFRVAYEPGTLTAVIYNSRGMETARTSLMSAGAATKLAVLPETKVLHEDELLYVRFRLTDDHGILKPLEREQLQITVQSGKLMAFGNACSYNARGYLTDTADTYYGEAMAIFQPNGREDIRFCVNSAYGKQEICCRVEEKAGSCGKTPV